MPLRTIVLLCVFAGVSCALAQPSPYFPERGRGALHQRSLELKNAAVVLSVAAEPGHEDLATLTALRMGSGTRIISLYVTNGASTRSDLNGDLPTRVAARRKEEAYRAISLIGSETHFLNFPDFGILDTRERLASYWRHDSVLAQFVTVLRTYRPDVLLLARDFRERGESTVRRSYIRDVVQEAVARAATLSPADTGTGRGPWHVGRIFEETDGGARTLSLPAETPHPVWKQSFQSISDEASAFYESLRLQIGAWNRNRPRTYNLLYPEARSIPAGLTSGMPVLGNAMRDIATSVRRAAEGAEREKRPQALWLTANALRRIDSLYTARQNLLTNVERRVAAAWSIGLEKLRCSLLNVEIGLEVSDSLIAEGQLLFLRCRTLKGAMGKEGTEILFPAAMSQEWGINESAQYRFPFAVPSEFRLVTPQKLELNLPGGTHGINSTAARIRFPVVIFHKDKDWTKNYVYRKEFLFQAGPRRSFEVVSSVVRVTPGEKLVVSMQNFSRDPFKGEMVIGDSIVREMRTPVVLPVKDVIRTETLTLAWGDSVPDGDHVIECRIARRPAGRFMARKFNADADTSGRIGLLTGVAGSPLEDALRRLHIPCALLDSAALDSGRIGECTAIVLDREAMTLRPDLFRHADDINAWVRGGGHLIVLPQYSAAGRESLLVGGIAFAPGPGLPPDVPIRIDSTSLLSKSPNRLTDADWQEWVIARAEGPLQVQDPGLVEVPLRHGLTGAPLVAVIRNGKGQATAVALDLNPQLQIVHPGVYRFLANLLSYRKGGG